MGYSSPKILIVDDDSDFVDAVSMILKKAAFDVASVSSPKQVKDKIFEEEPDLIILDIMMESLFDGFSLCKEIRTSSDYKRFNNIPIIFVSSVRELTGERFDIKKEAEGHRGPDAYLDKPFKPKELLNKIESLLHK